MKISVVVPSYQHARFIRQTLDSLLAQDRPDLEILVFDGGSTDGTVEILESYGDRIHAVSRKDHGQTDAINQGLRQATGEILAYLNSDDVYLPGALDRVVRHFEENPRSLCVYGQAYHLHEDGSKMERYYSEPWSYPRLLDVCYLCQPAVFWRREVIERFGVFDDRLNWAMDYDYWLRVGRAVRFDYLEDAYLAGSRLHEDTKTLSQRVKVHEEILEIVMRHSPVPPDRWLVNLAHMIVDDQKIPNFRGTVTPQLRKAWIVETALERADHYQFPVGKKLLDLFEQWL
jgi:glycosyltransferase involved in cell wall biosynthesis